MLKFKKSNPLLFNLSRNKKHKKSINISIEDQKLAQKEYAKYLGSVLVTIYLRKNTLKLRSSKLVKA